MTRTILVGTFAAVALSGCAHPRVLQDDFSATYMEALELQADRGRPTAADAAYPLTGFEGIELRQRVTEESTDEESGTLEAVQSFQVQ